MFKPRVVIRSLSCRRDVAGLSLLAKLLEHMGCEALVTGVRDFERTVRYWKPDIIVVNAVGAIQRSKMIAPKTRLIYLDGEGLVPLRYSQAKFFSENEDVYDMPDSILLWGETTKRELIDVMLKKNKDVSKLQVVGNINLDLAKFIPSKYRIKNKSLGFVSRFHRLNDHLGRAATQHLPSDGSLEDTINQCKAFVGMINTARVILDRTDYNISIRPHPLEQIESYQEYIQRWFGKENVHRIEVDDTLSFSQWAVKQDALVSPTSTSFVKAYILKVPVINIDNLSNTEEYCKNLEEDHSQKWQSAGVRPTSYDNLIEIINSGFNDFTLNSQIEDQLVNYCNFDYSYTDSACLKAAKIINSHARKNSINKNKIHMPRCVVDLIDELSFRKAMYKNKLHGNVNYRRGYHSLPPYTNDIVEMILSNHSD